MPFFKTVWNIQSTFWTAWPFMGRSRGYNRQSSREDLTLLPAHDDSLYKNTSPGTRCGILILTIGNILFFSLNIVLFVIASFKLSDSPLGAYRSKTRLNAALKELSSYCQSLGRENLICLLAGPNSEQRRSWMPSTLIAKPSSSTALSSTTLRSIEEDHPLLSTQLGDFSITIYGL